VNEAKRKTNAAKEYKCNRKETHKENFTPLSDAVKYFCYFGMVSLSVDQG
jgi:hypothetical protein